MPSRSRVALACAAAAVAVSGAAALATLSVNEWKVSALVRMSNAEPMARLAVRADPDFRFVHTQAHYDGVYFYAIALDPFARGEAHQLIDRAAYRYGHAGYGWLARLVSLGSESAVPGALLAVSLAGVAIAAYAASLLAQELGWSPWAGMLVALSPGVVFAVTVDTSEPAGMAAVALALLAWTRRRWKLAAVGLVAGCLIKEPLLLVPAGLAAWEALAWARGRAPADLGARLAAIVAGPVVFAAWYVYLRITFGIWPFRDETRDFFAVPFTGWWDSARRAARLAVDSFDRAQIGNASIALLVVVFALLLIGAVRAARLRWWLDPVYLLFAALLFSLNWLALQYPKDLIREAVVALALLPAVLAGPPPAVRHAPGPDLGPG
jgi:MYXO-CTERM domain-containing protein